MIKKNIKNKNLIKKSSKLYLLIVIALGILIIAGAFYMIFTKKEWTLELLGSGFILLTLEIFAILVSFELIRSKKQIKNNERKYEEMEKLNNKISDLNKNLRVQRHDFLNHIQVVHGLIELGQNDDAKEYMEKTYKEIQSINNVLKTSLPAINAILQVKQTACEKTGIKIKILATSKLDDMTINVWNLSAIIGNLIDNAINAVEKSGRKVITILIRENLKEYIIKIKDKGDGIPKEIQKKLFMSGVTTKNDENHGMGLAISREYLENVNGSLTFETSDKGTIFTIKVPKTTFKI